MHVTKHPVDFLGVRDWFPEPLVVYAPMTYINGLGSPLAVGYDGRVSS